MAWPFKCSSYLYVLCKILTKPLACIKDSGDTNERHTKFSLE